MTERPSEPLNSNDDVSAVAEKSPIPDEKQPSRLETLLVDEETEQASPPLSHADEKNGSGESSSAPWQVLTLVFLVFVTLVLGLVLVMFYRQPAAVEPQAVVMDEVRQSIAPKPVNAGVRPDTSESSGAARHDAGESEAADGPAAVATDTADRDSDNASAGTPPESSRLSVGQPAAAEQALFSVVVGPFINTEGLRQAESILSEYGLQAQKRPGRGLVHMIRLEEGVYPPDEAVLRLKELKRLVSSAFLLPRGEQKVLFAGSFFEELRALKLQKELRAKGVEVALVPARVTMKGTLLVALNADRQTARQLAEYIGERGLNAQIEQAR